MMYLKHTKYKLLDYMSKIPLQSVTLNSWPVQK